MEGFKGSMCLEIRLIRRAHDEESLISLQIAQSDPGAGNCPSISEGHQKEPCATAAGSGSRILAGNR